MARTTASTNGRMDARKQTRKPARKHGCTPARKVAYGCAGVGLSMLALSLVDCTHAIIHLTSMHPCLAFLMAVGVDAGLVASECAEMVARENARMRARLIVWVRAMMAVCMGASMILNCVGVWMNAPMSSRVLATVFAGTIPIMVFIMGRIVGALVDE